MLASKRLYTISPNVPACPRCNPCLCRLTRTTSLKTLYARECIALLQERRHGSAVAVSAAPASSNAAATSQDDAAAPGPGSRRAAEASVNSRSGVATNWSDVQMALVWDSVTRALLRLGSGGAQPSHATTLRELLLAHKLVKVQLNGDPLVLITSATIMAEAAGAQLLGQKGRTLLYAPADAMPDSLLAEAQQSMVKIKKYHEKVAARRAAERKVRDAQREVRAGKGLRDALSRARSTGSRRKQDADSEDDEQAGLASAEQQQQQQQRLPVVRVAVDAGPKGTQKARAKKPSRAPWRQAFQRGGDLPQL